MPNIEIHGLDTAGADVVRSKIDWAMQKNDKFKNEAIITIFNDITENCDIPQISQPFLRIYSSEDNGEQVAEMILHEGVDMDIEIVKLQKFIPKFIPTKK